MITYEQMQINEEKLSSAFVNDTKIHLVLTDKSFRNGFVKEIFKTHFIFDDVKNGKEAIFNIELLKIEPFMEATK